MEKKEAGHRFLLRLLEKMLIIVYRTGKCRGSH